MPQSYGASSAGGQAARAGACWVRCPKAVIVTLCQLGRALGPAARSAHEHVRENFWTNSRLPQMVRVDFFTCQIGQSPFHIRFWETHLMFFAFSLVGALLTILLVGIMSELMKIRSLLEEQNKK
jgi:energy-converting hydrogenase Eha subunit E